MKLRFVAHPGLFTWLVWLVQYRQFWASHIEAVLPTGEHIGSWFRKGGVRVQPADYDKGGFTREFYLEIDATAEQEAAFFAFLDRQLFKPYDWRAIVSFGNSRDWQEPDSWECTELIAAALAACGLFPQEMAVKFSRLTPRDLLLLASPLTKD